MINEHIWIIVIIIAPTCGIFHESGLFLCTGVRFSGFKQENIMTEAQIKQITEMRNAGFGYTTIATTMKVSKDCVRSYCRTHGLTGKRAPTHIQKVGKEYCKTCGKPLEHTIGKRKKQFCSDGCRMDWWNSHSDQVKRKAYYPFTCASCGKKFTSYGNAKRTYCSHECYIKARFSTEKNS